MKIQIWRYLLNASAGHILPAGRYFPTPGVAHFTKWFTIYFYCWCVDDIFFQSPLVNPCVLVPFRLSKHNLSNPLSQHQSHSQAELFKPTREYFKISKRKRTRGLSEYIPIYQSSLQCDFCIPNHLVTRPVTMGRASPPWKNFLPPEKMSWAYCMHNHFFRTCYRCKIGPTSKNS